MIIMRGDENPQRPLESDPGSPRRSTGNGKFREFLEGGGKFGGDWKRVLCAGMGARNERKLQCGDFSKLMKRRMWCGVKDGPRRRPCYIWRLCATWKVAQCSTRTRCGARCFPARMRGMAASRSKGTRC